MRLLKPGLIAAIVVLLASPSWAQTGGAVAIKAIDTSSGATTDVGDNTNHAVRVNIIAGAGSGGTALADEAAFTQGTTSITPAGCLYKTSYTGLSTGQAGVLQCTTDGMAYVNVGKVNGIAVLTGTGATGTGAQRVTIAGDTATIAGSAPGTAGTASAQVLSIQGIASMTKLLVTPDSVALPANQSTNESQINGVTPLMGNGTTGTGSQRVTIASDNTAFSVNAAESGTWTVQPGNTPNTSQWLVKSGPFDACGTTTYDPASVLIGDTTLDSLTATTTCVESIVVSNVGSAQATITVQDVQGTPVQLLKVVPVAPGATLILAGLGGVKFASGIKYQASTASALSIWVKGRQ